MDETTKTGQGRASAYLTVYLTLTMTIVLSLCLALIEGVRQNAVFLEAQCVTDIGLNSILAEYHRELLAQYNLFAIDSSYGSVLPQTAATAEHLREYVEKNLSSEDVFMDWLLYRDFLGIRPESVEVTGVSILTDEKGAVFRKRAAEALWDDLNLNLFQELQQWMQVVESEQLMERDVLSEKEKLDKKLDSYNGKTVQISETEWIDVEVVNPTAALEKKRKDGILKWVVDDPGALSEKRISTSNSILTRMAIGKINQGNIEIEKPEEAEKLLERFLFQEYLMRYMGYYGAEDEESALTYQIEYLIMGKTGDYENLQSVVNQIFTIREAANLIYLLSDQEKCAAAEVVGTVLAGAMGIPEAGVLLKMILLCGWSFAESLYDMECLMAGERVVLQKTSDTWHYNLESALKLSKVERGSQAGGLSYADYLRILLWLQPEETLTARAMNMVETDIRQTPGNASFRLDGCLDTVEACVGIKSVYGYTCEITGCKSYAAE